MQWISDFFASFFSLMSTFRPQDLLDILLVAFIFYNAIRLVRETRAIQLVKGIVLLAVVYLVVNVLDMQAIGYILDVVIKFGVVIIVILFQPEMRHALESIGRSSFTRINLFGSKNSDAYKQNERLVNSATHIARACESMSGKKIGALIVFEKYTLLGEIIKTGTVVDAESSASIIENIFFPKAPLHDGAMIIRDGKVHAAGCILPLTQNNAISSELGTRHRAALGLTEQSDAVVVIVSEETGAISVAEKGVLKRNISVNELRNILLNQIVGEDSVTNENVIAQLVKKVKDAVSKRGKKNEK